MKGKYSFNEKNQFVIEDYDKAKTFASFLPGIAGLNGIPMWSFYVNRGQAMASFGVKDKDGSIMEFFPANTMYKNVELQGFRTFLKYKDSIHEIFSSYPGDKAVRRMLIEKNVLILEEINKSLNVKVTITYFTMLQEDFAAIVRRVKIENLDGKVKELEILDGLTQILPFGISNDGYKQMSNVSRAWFDVYNLENKIAYYRVRATLGDTEEVGEVTKGNFYLSFSSQSDKLIQPIVDMELIFGGNTSLTFPEGFRNSIEEIYRRDQITTNKTSGGFTGAKVILKDQFELCTLIGHATVVDFINDKAAQFSIPYINRKEKEARQLVDSLVEKTYTKTSNQLFDQYINQCYLDNMLRGGYPLIFPCGGENKVYHVYSRKHGDLEREYNFFSVEAAYYSQGNGNYRDVNQNRRDDVFFYPDIKDFNVKQFMNLIQLDGYNPLHVKGSTFRLKEEGLEKVLTLADTGQEGMSNLLKGSFTPGLLMSYIAENKVILKVSKEELLDQVMKASEQNYEAEYGEGYWSDHWTYNMDLIEAYLRIYPDQLEGFLFEDCTYRFFDSPVRIVKREEKYVLVNGAVRQYGAVEVDKEKNAQLGIRLKDTNWLKKQKGTGEIYETNLFVKLFSLMLNKFLTLDPYGMGIEMEAGKPGWNDAMNGLPGLFGAGISETAELKRIVEFLSEASGKFERSLRMPTEITETYKKALTTLEEYLCGHLEDYEYWDRMATLREDYREQIRFGILGEEEEISSKELFTGLRNIGQKIDQGLERALEFGEGIYPTYIYYEAKKYELQGEKKNSPGGYPNVKVTEFEPKLLPFYLEGPTRVLKGLKDANKANELYQAIKSSDIYDKKLKMYKTSEPIDAVSHEIGRARAFTAGWLEREAVFMHMEYKYLLAVLKAGLYHQYFSDIQTMLAPFLSPQVYGRSTLENSSFIASSMNPDPQTHGQGYVARLTGATAEMLSMWILMMMGDKGFTYENNVLELHLNPILPGWMFQVDGQVSFKLLGKTMVTYYNPEKKNTFGEDGVQSISFVLEKADGEIIELNHTRIQGENAEGVRRGEFSKIRVYLA